MADALAADAALAATVLAAANSALLGTTIGIEVESSRPFQESSMVRLTVGSAEAHFEPWLNVVLCVANGSHYRVELQLFSPTRETREQWRAIYESP